MADKKLLGDAPIDDSAKRKQINPDDLERSPGVMMTPHDYTPPRKSSGSGTILRGSMAPQSFSRGGMVKHGSPKVSAPCRDTKTVKC
jgi:hypothetical protein